MPDDDQLPELHDSDQAAARMRIAARGSMMAFVWMIVVQSVFLVVLMAAVGYLLVAYSQASASAQRTAAQTVQRDDQRWCSTFDLLTSAPVAAPADPASNPSREYSYKLYADFLALKAQFGCS